MAELKFGPTDLSEIGVIDDTNDRRVDRRGFLSERLARRPSFEHDEHAFIKALAHFRRCESTGGAVEKLYA